MARLAGGLSRGDDGVVRCFWGASDPLYVRYHDEEWGSAVRDDVGLFERLSLEAFQAGLSWLLILRKRAAFRAAFAGFDPAIVARFTPADVDRLMLDATIVRNRAKIEATIANAGRCLDQVPAGLSELLWGFAPPLSATPAVGAAAATTMARDLRGRGFRFVGPTTCLSLMQAVGMVNGHEPGCWRSGR